jgi:hypothetical protein
MPSFEVWLALKVENVEDFRGVFNFIFQNQSCV